MPLDFTDLIPDDEPAAKTRKPMEFTPDEPKELSFDDLIPKKRDRIGEMIKGQEEASKALSGVVGKVQKFAGDVARNQAEDVRTGYADKPGFTYGTTLPYAKNEQTGEVEWGHSPESARGIIRGILHTRDFDINDPQQRSDVAAVAAATAGFSRPPGIPPISRPPPGPRTEPSFAPTEPPGGPGDARWGVRAPQLEGPPGATAPVAPETQEGFFTPDQRALGAPAPPPEPGPPALTGPAQPLALPAPNAPEPTLSAPVADISVDPIKVGDDDFRDLFPNLSDDQFRGLFSEAAKDAGQLPQDRQGAIDWLTQVRKGIVQRATQTPEDLGRQPGETETSRPQLAIEGPKGDPWSVVNHDLDFLPDETPQAPAAAAPIAPVEPPPAPPEPAPAPEAPPAAGPRKPEVGTFQDLRTAGYDANPDHPLAGRIDHLKKLAESPDLLPREQRELNRRVRDFEKFNDIVADLPLEQRAMVRSLRPDDLLQGKDKDGRTIVGRVEGFGADGLIGVSDENGLHHDIPASSVEDVRHFAAPIATGQDRREEEKPPELVPDEPAPVEAHGGPWNPVLDKEGEHATNPQGIPLYENRNGVRSIMEDGVPYTERTKEDPELGLVPHDIVNRKGQFLTKEESGLERPRAPKSTTEGPAPQRQRDDGTVEPPEAPKGKAPEVPEHKKNETEDWKYFADNEEGDPIYTNDQGVHSIVKDGTRIIEKVRLRPTKDGGTEMYVPPPMEKEPSFRPRVEEKPAPKPKAAPDLAPSGAKSEEAKPEAPKVEPSADALHSEIVNRMKADKTLAAHLSNADEDPQNALLTLKRAYAKHGVDFLTELMGRGEGAPWAPFFGQPREADEAVLAEVLGRPAPTKPTDTDKSPAVGPVIPPGDDYYPPIASGERLRSKSGREMSPAPTFTVDTPRRENIARTKMNEWLVNEARNETAATGDTNMASWAGAMDPKNMSQSDRDLANDILFGDPEGPKAEHRITEAAPAPAPAASRPAKKPKPGTVTNEMLAEYFTPGQTVLGYGNTRDMVVAFHPVDDRGRWSVDVREVKRNGELGHLRNHMTMPTMREVEAVRKERGTAAPPAPAPDKTATVATLPAEAPNPALAGIPKTAYRGTGRADAASAYNGVAEPIAGPGRYSAFSKTDAEAFGPHIEEVPVDLANPLVIRSDPDWRALTKEAGWEFPNPYGMPADEMKAAAARLKQVVQSKGHDGIIAWWNNDTPYDADEQNRPIKTLRNALGVPQVIDYRDAPSSVPAPGQADQAFHYTDGDFGMSSNGSFTKDRSRWMTFTPDEAARISGVRRPYGATRDGVFVGVDSGKAFVPPEQTPEQAFAAADAEWRAYQPTFDKATADYRAQRIGDDEYLRVRAENERLRDAVDAAQDALPDAEELERQRAEKSGLDEATLNEAYRQADDKSLAGQMDDIREMLKSGWSYGDIATRPGIDRTPTEIRALEHVWREQGFLPWETRDIGQAELPLTPQEKYDALYPSDTPAATGEPDLRGPLMGGKTVTKGGTTYQLMPRGKDQYGVDIVAPTAADSDVLESGVDEPGWTLEQAADEAVKAISLNPSNELPTVIEDETGSSGSGPAAGGLGQPKGGSVRTSRPGSRSGGRGGRGQGLASPPTPDVPTAEDLGDPGEDGVRDEPTVPGGDEPLSGGGDAADGRPGAGDSGVDDAGAGEPGPVEPSAANTRPNFYISDPETMVGGGAKVRFNRNRRAIEAFRDIQDEGRQPTEAELETMAGFTGWGSFGQDLFQGTFARPTPREGWDTEGQWLREHLGEEAWRAAQASIENAHYTDPPTVTAMWNMVRQMGFQGGRILEPSMGVGNFFGLMPRDLMGHSTLTGIELEPTTGGMAKLLYPQAGVFIKGYQESQTPDNFYDLVIGNWPFSAVAPADRRYNRLRPTLHDFFYLKALDQTRPGGLVVGITSAGTMDKMDRLVRMEMAKKGELIAAFRLPSGAFEKYAGTKVVTDIMILRKRTEPLTDAAAEPWIETKEMETPSGEPIRVNQYYHDHPENVLGTFDFGHGTTQYRAGMIVHRPADLAERLQYLPAKLPVDAYAPVTRGNEPRFITNNSADRFNSVVVGDDDKLYQVAGERLLLLEDVHKGMKAGTPKIQQQRIDQIKDLVAMRKAYGSLIDAERDGAPETELLRETLHNLYSRYIRANKGRLIDTAGMKVLDRVKDPNWPILAALQKPDGSPSKILTEPVTRQRRKIGNPSVSDAYVMARNETVTLDMPRIAELSHQPIEGVIQHLEDAGAIYRTPGGGYDPSDEYLTGNVRRKLREAEDALERGEPMQRSVEALRKVIPRNTPYYEIEAKLGAPWVPDQDYQRFFAQHLLDLPEDRWPEVQVAFNGGKWTVEMPSRITDSIEATQTHGHPRYRFDRLVTAAMGNTSPRIMDPRDSDGGPYYNPTATEEVATRIQEIREKYQDWVWADAERAVRLEEAFNNAMNAIAKPHFDGSFMDMSGMALTRGDDPFDMRKHQANAIWRGIALRRGLFAHEVGTGKTYTIGGIAIEGRRYGRWNKPMLLAHNANSKAVASEIQQMYPGAKILSIDSDDLSPQTLKQSMYSIRNEDWDLVIIQHSHINRMALKRETLMGLAREQITAIEDEMYAAAAEDDVDLSDVDLSDEKDIDKKIRSVTAKQLAKQRLKILNNIEAQAQRSSRADAIPFEDLGVDAIFVDEAHEFKKPPIATRMKVKGLNTDASARSIALDFLTKYVKNNNNGNNVFLFTGTPVTNALNEIFNMSKYFMDDVMKRDGIADWDTWFNTFADALNDVELVSTGDYESIKRLSSFVNVDELVRVMSQFTDVVQASDMPEFVDRPTPSGKTLSSPDLSPEERDFLENGRTENPSGRPYKRIINDVSEILPEQAVIQEELRQRVREFKAAPPRWRMMNRHIPVVVDTEMSNSSLDARMFNPEAIDNPNNKVNRVARNVLEVYRTPQAAQMIFVDKGYNPGKRNPNFDLMDDLVDKLVKGGIPRNEIAIVAGGVTPDQKKKIADGMNDGKIRVAIGQSGTLGVGVNAQANLRAMHHMDAPWRPGDLEQRNGRGHRQGNSWNTVLEYRYITEGIDGRRWQVLTIKDRFIKQFIGAFNDESGKRIGVIEGDAADISEDEDIMTTLSAAAGDPRLMLKEKLKGDVNRLQRREQTHVYGVADAQRRARDLAASIQPMQNRRDGWQRWVDTWQEAAARMDAAGKEAGAKVVWYDAVVDGQPLNTSAEIQDAFDKRVRDLAQGEGEVKLGSINGFNIVTDWRKGQSEPYYHLVDAKGDTVGDTMNGLTVQKINGQMTKVRNWLKENPNWLDDIRSDIAKLQKAAEQPFTQEAALLKKRQQLAQLEDDLQENPIPPPAWLRHGAPIDTPIWVDGKELMVRGHRMKDDYYLTTDDGDVNYMRATDQNGFSLFTQRPLPAPPPPKDLPDWAPPLIAAVEGEPQVIWHRGDLVLVKAHQYDEDVFLGFKKGLSIDQQAWNVYGMRGAFDVKDIDKLRSEAESWRDRERNRKALEEDRKAKAAAAAPKGPLLLTADPEAPWLKAADPEMRRMLADREAAQTARARELAEKWIRRQTKGKPN